MQRSAEGFAGAAGASAIVLIFADGFEERDVQKVEADLQHYLGSTPPLSIPTTGSPGSREAYIAMLDKFVVFDVLSSPMMGNVSGDESAVLRFRLTGRRHFKIPASAYLGEDPYVVDVDGMNRELASLVSMSQGAPFISMGEGLEAATGRTCLALLWPLSTHVLLETDAMEVIDRFEETMQIAAKEADALLKRYFAHVKSCFCGH